MRSRVRPRRFASARPIAAHRATAATIAAATEAGVVVLESGYGSGTYSHDEPCVHGLWPQTPTYGSSECVAASSNSTPTELYSCYDDLSFEQHEWEQHGLCAGVNDAGDFFTQLCSITAAPLKVSEKWSTLRWVS